MTVRGADYPRRPMDDYSTPPEVTAALLKFMYKELSIRLCDPAPGAGQMVKTFKDTGYRVVRGPRDFLQQEQDWNGDECDFLMNPPYGDRRMNLAVAFVDKALKISWPWRGKVVALLPFDFDCARSRRYLFEQRAFAGKIVLPSRIKWFNDKSGSLEHAWFVWNHRHKGRPWIRYMPTKERII